MGRQHCPYIVCGFMSYGRTMTLSGCLELWDLITTTHLNLSGSLAKPPLILTHWGRVTDICVGNLTIIGSDNGLSPGRRPAITWTCWNIVNWKPWNKLRCNVNRNSYIFIHENPFENVVWKMAAILSRPQCGCDDLSLLQFPFTH